MRPTVRSFQFAALFILAHLLAACSTLGLQSARNVTDQIQYAKATTGALARTVGDAAESKQLTGTTARKHYDRLAELRADIKLSEDIQAGIKPGGTATAAATIRSVLVALNQISAELTRQGVKAAPVAVPPAS